VLNPSVNFVLSPDPDHPGWETWNLPIPRAKWRDIGPADPAAEGDKVRLRMETAHQHSNLLDAVHGGVLLGLADVSLFATARLIIGEHLDSAVTLDLSCQFIGAGQIGKSAGRGRRSVARNGRVVFMRGIIEQDGAIVAAYNATLRKPSVKR
jgi:uncharacterized protein (TIGR00369 family)